MLVSGEKDGWVLEMIFWITLFLACYFKVPWRIISESLASKNLPRLCLSKVVPNLPDSKVKLTHQTNKYVVFGVVCIQIHVCPLVLSEWNGGWGERWGFHCSLYGVSKWSGRARNGKNFHMVFGMRIFIEVRGGRWWNFCVIRNWRGRFLEVKTH